MSPKRARRAPNARTAPPPKKEASDPGARAARWILAAIFVCVGLLVDSGADASFDAPKRLMALAGISLATLALFGFSRWDNPFRAERLSPSNVAALAAVAALGLALVSALASPRRGASLDALRVLALTALAVPIGASRVLERSGGFLLGCFLAVSGLNAVVSILQSRGLYSPFQLQTQGSREATGAFVGNVGYLALVLALAAVAALSVSLLAESRGARIAAAATLPLFLAALLVNQNLTSFTALAAGVAVLLLVRFRKRAVLPILGGLVLLAAVVTAYPATRLRERQALSAIRAGDWDRLLTYRMGAWRSALEMTRERPLVGWGPGTFGAEFVRERLKTEISARRRFVNPLVTSSYSEAHSDYLQPFAELGIPAAILLLAAAAILLRESARAALSPVPRRREAAFLLAFLAAGAAAALTWFPMQRPVSSIPLLLAAGRAWRIGRSRPETSR
jgi:O-antigen ligase